MTTSLSFIIAYVGTYTRVISVAAAGWRWKYLRGGVLLFAYLEVISLGFTVYSTVTINDGNNSYLEFISLGIDAFAMALIFGPLMPSRMLRQLVLAFGPLFIVGLAADYWWGEGPRQMGANYAAALECGLVSAITVIYLQKLLQNQTINLRRSPMAIISSSLLLINLIALPVFLFGPALMSYSMTLTLRAYDLLYLSSIVAHLGSAYAFWLTKPADTVQLSARA